MRPCWIGVDLGTGSVRALAVGSDGAVLASATHPLRSSRRHRASPDGAKASIGTLDVPEDAFATAAGGGSELGSDGARHEQDPAEWIEAVAGVLSRVTTAMGAVQVRGVAVDGTSGTVALTDAAGTVVTPGVMYDDARGAGHAEKVRAAGDGLWERLGHGMGASWALPTLLEMLPEHPGARVAHQVDVVTTWLTGTPAATDENTALKTGYDVLARAWPVDVLDALGVDPAALPDVVPAGTPIGVVGAAAARATGLAAGTPVLAGTTDGCAAQIGAGAVRPGAWHAVLGTTLVLKGVATGLLRDPAGVVYSHRAPSRDLWWPGGASSVGAGVLPALLDPGCFDALTAAAPPDPPVAFPLAGHGERFPFAADDAEGFWLGDDGGGRPLSSLVADVGEPAAFAALCEGVAFVERLAFDRLAGLGADVTGPRTISGGATANRWWNQRRADAGGHPLAVPATVEPAFGTALLAAVGTGAFADLGAAADAAVRVVETLDPRPDPALDERYGAFLEALRARGWW